MTILDYLFAFIPLLGTLIFVHELGHFLAAKACGVRVLKFSLGFGPPIGFGRFRLRWLRAGTEYVIAWLPLGGFVKMLGEPMPGADPESEPQIVIDATPDEYMSAKRTWQKLLITFAGPAMNLLLPVVAFWIILWIGIPRATNVIGMVEQGSPAAAVGIQAGDRVMAIDGQPVSWWDEAHLAIAEQVATSLEFEVDRGGERMLFDVPVERRGVLDAFGAVEQLGWIGVASRRQPNLLGVPFHDVPAARAGLRSGDRVVRVGDREVEDWEGIRRAFEELGPAASGDTVPFEVLRREGDESEPASRVSDVPALASLEELGVVPATVLVSVVTPEMPAAEAGLKRGDLLLAVDGRPVGSFTSFANTVRTSGGREMELTYARDGETTTVTLEPRLREVEGRFEIEGMTEQIYQVGIGPELVGLLGDSALHQARNPLVAVPRAVEMTLEITIVFLRGLGKLVSGSVGTDKLGGPILIAEIARKSLDLGWRTYLGTMMLISINLGILNLLPIPILDGGQALIYLVEGVKRSPISVRSRELVQQTGLIMIVMLMAVAFWNDLSRHWAQFVEWMSSAL